MNNCSFRWKIYRLSLFFKEYVSIKNEFVEKMVRQRKTVHPFVIPYFLLNDKWVNLMRISVVYQCSYIFTGHYFFQVTYCVHVENDNG